MIPDGSVTSLQIGKVCFEFNERDRELVSGLPSQRLIIELVDTDQPGPSDADSFKMVYLKQLDLS